MIGQGLMPRDYHPLVDALSTEQLDDLLSSVKAIIDKAAAAVPAHEDFLAKHCKAS